ncbi:MerR family transcriptional regulator [Metabacillus iocasae]|uniref:DNA-binding transcriptional MerR regulator n=1 Tax=Priestia iocasae TaxID=2291674 RepID=A0ABS2QTJ9_9BACI|nr:MerR family transcriptional regulator [Metabacillus iocasae]MBM7702801.1 DNA-binding transcriptional MerR regulator [Metabacillus iocasae]
MEYTVKKLAKLAGVTSRTLRYYDEIGILKPARINSSGYRIYGEEEVDRLQQILFYRELDVDLETIHHLLSSPTFDHVKALEEHREKLLTKRKQLDLLIQNVNQTLAAKEGRMMMSDQEKFEGFKQQLIDENEKKHGKEVREKYGDDQVNKSNEKLKGMSQAQYEEAERLGEEVLNVLHEAFQTEDPASDLAQKAADLHRQWLSSYWDEYSKEAHAGLAQMYVDDERFTAYYDKRQPGMAAFLRDAVLIYAGTKS